MTRALDAFDQGNRREIIERVLKAHGVEDMAGELTVMVRAGEFGDALFSFVQAITQLMDVSFLTRPRVRSTFQEDFRTLLVEHAPRVTEFDYANSQFDPQGTYRVPAYVRRNNNQHPLLVFPIANDDQCKLATIVLLKWESWSVRFQSVAVFQDQTKIARPDLARLSDTVGQQYHSLDAARERLPGLLAAS